MPTYAVRERFAHQLRQLRPEQRELFLQALRVFIQILREWEADGCQGVPRFPRSLGVKPMVNRRGVMEMAWAPDGRCTWEFGTPQRQGKAHIIWRRIGSHAIYEDP